MSDNTRARERELIDAGKARTEARIAFGLAKALEAALERERRDVEAIRQTVNHHYALHGSCEGPCINVLDERLKARETGGDDE